MRRGLPTLALALTCLAAAVPAAAQAELRWIAYVRGAPDRLQGSLEVVRSDGRRHRTLIEDGVTAADVGPRGTVFAVSESEEGRSLVRAGARGEEPAPLEAGPPGAFLLGVAASPDDGVAVGRFVPRQVEPPEHLDGTLRALARTNVAVLVPPERPPGTTGTVAEASGRFYDLLFTNDPERELSHAEQINRFVRGSLDPQAAPPEATSVPVRETEGSFSCGASACFLQWEEFGVTYSVGEFGRPEDAVGFAESLVLIDELLGPAWRAEEGFQVPQVVTITGEGTRVLDGVRRFCECAFRPVDWDEDRVLVILGVEGFTTLRDYPAAGGEPRVVEEGTGGTILDAAYGPEGVLLLVGGEGGPPGELRAGDGEVIAEGVRAFDAEGDTLVYVREDGSVVVRDRTSGDEREVGSGAIDVSIGPDTIRPRPSPSPASIPPAPDGEGFPTVLVVLVGGGAAALLAGSVLLAAALRRRRR